MGITSILDDPDTYQTTLMHSIADIRPIDKQEAFELATFELQQVLNLLDQLDGADWEQPTDCTEWNVQQMTAHLAGGCAGWATLRDFSRQTIFNPYMSKVKVPVDAINRREVEDRAHKTPQQLIDELRRVGPKAIRNRKNLPGFLRKIKIDAKPMPGKMSLAYLVDIIYTRDQWMHRMDLCRATGKDWVANPDHDQRLLDLIVRDMTQAHSLPIVIHVTGALKTSYRFGTDEPKAELDIDLFTLNRRSSGRITSDQALDTAQARGDMSVVRAFLQNCEVLY